MSGSFRLGLPHLIENLDMMPSKNQCSRRHVPKLYPTGYGCGYRFGYPPPSKKNGCMVAEQVLSVEETCDVLS